MERMIENKKYSKRLSIIVPVYNVEKYIERCLLSLLNQDIPKDEYEIIVVDDGTPDNSAKIAQYIANGSENITVVHRENGGLSAARNTGLEHAHGRYIFFVDSDDYIEPNVLSSLLKSAESRNLELLGFSTCRRNRDNKITWTKKIDDFIDDKNVIDCITLLRKGFKPTTVWAYLYSSEMLNSYFFRFYEGIIHEDIEFNYRVFTKIKRFGAVDSLIYNYCMNDEHSITQGRTLQQEAYALMSNMEVAASIKKYIRQEDIPDDIFKQYDSNMNSMLINQIVCFLKGNGRKQPIEFVKQYILRSKELCVYPIKGYNFNLRARIARLFINIEPFLFGLVRISRK